MNRIKATDAEYPGAKLRYGYLEYRTRLMEGDRFIHVYNWKNNLIGLQTATDEDEKISNGKSSTIKPEYLIFVEDSETYYNLKS